MGVESQSQSTADSSSCPYGRRADGTCRACPQLDHYHNGNRCVPKPSSGQRCPSGQTYYSSYGGCRPSPCTYGRTSSGYCNPRPSCPAGQTYSGGRCVSRCPAGQTYFSQYGGCRPSNCGKPGRSSTGYCRTCTDPTHYHNGRTCVPKTAPAPGDPSCPTGQLYYGSYGGCRSSSCAHGRTTSGTCNPPPPTTTTTATTTTTTASCPEGQEYFSRYGGCRPSSCEHDRSSTGYCRACADLTHYYNGRKCVPKTAPAPGDPSCPTGELYYGSYEGCRPSSCTHGRTSSGSCSPPPPTTTPTNFQRLTTTTTTATDSCPEGQRHFSEHGGCRPVSCDGVRLSTGHCREDDQENPWYVTLTCGNYSASEDAEWYLNMDEKEKLTKRLFRTSLGERRYGVTKADVEAFSGGRNCPVMGLFRAGTIQREESTKLEERTGESEIYVPELAYDKTIYEGYPPGAKNPDVKAYGLVTIKPKPPSDICSGGQKNQADYYDRRVPCKAHDYCWDLVRFAVAPGLSKYDCDDKFHDLMNSDCADRDNDRDNCRNDAWWWTQWVRPVGVSDHHHPGVVIIENVKTGMCVDVESSDEDSARLIQWPCEDKNGQISKHRQFRFNIRSNPAGAWYFQIKPEHQLQSYCVSVTDNHNVVMRYPIFCLGITDPFSFPRITSTKQSAPSSSLFVLVEDNVGNEERYTIRSSDLPNRCWSPATSDQGSHLINSSPCNRGNDLHLWEIKEVER